MISRSLILIILISSSLYSNAQCTIPNGDFENFDTINRVGLHGPLTYELPQDWIETPLANIVSRFTTGDGLFYRYTGSDAYGSALQIQRSTPGSFLSANNGYLRFACTDVPDRLTGRIKFSGSSKAGDGWEDRFTIAAFLSTVSDTLRVSDQLNQCLFPSRAKYFIAETPIDSFINFSIDLSDFQGTGENYEYFTIMTKMNLTYFPTIDWEYSIAVLDDLKLEYNTVSTFEIENDKSPEIYPNPVRDNLYIKNNNAFKKASFQILDISGRLILEGKTMSGEIQKLNVEGLLGGVYILRLLNAEQKVLTYKFVK